MQEISLSTLVGINFDFVETILLSKYSKRQRRPAHPPVAMLKALIFQKLKHIPSWRQLSRTIASDEAVMKQLGFNRPPNHSSFTYFTKRIGEETLQMIFLEFVSRLRSIIPDLGEIVGVDATLVRAYSKPPMKRGQPKSDPAAQWGVQGTNFGRPIWVYGYKLQLISDSKHEIPLSYCISSANASENKLLLPHLSRMLETNPRPDVLVADAGYDSRHNTMACIKAGIKPVIALNPRRGPRPRPGKKVRIRRDYVLPISRHSLEWDHYYSMRSSCERINSRLKEGLGLTELKLRTIARVSVHFVLSLVAMVLIAYVSYAVGRPELYLSVEPWRY
jgi:hypothetical protein